MIETNNTQNSKERQALHDFLRGSICEFEFLQSINMIDKSKSNDIIIHDFLRGKMSESDFCRFYK